jgi:hypothetical protein
VSTSSSIEVEGSDSGMEPTNEYEGIASSPAREQRLRNDLVLQQTFENKEYPSSMPERERKFTIVPSNFRRYREEEPEEKPPSKENSKNSDEVSNLHVVQSTGLQVGGFFGQIGVLARTSTRGRAYADAPERPLERPFESHAWAPPYEVKVDSLEDPQPDSIADIANGRKKSFWQRFRAKFAK